MGDVLSQNEIDSLLAALSTGELNAEEIAHQDEKQVSYRFTAELENHNVVRVRKESADE